MKKLFFMILALGALTFGAHAQSMTKEEKAKAKAAKEQALTDAIKELGISKDDEKKLRAILDDAAEKGKEVKNDDSLTEEQKAAKKETINTEKNDKLKELLGAEKYRQWNAIRKKQKEAAAAAGVQ